MRAVLTILPLLLAVPACAANDDYELADVHTERPRIIADGAAGVDYLKVRAGISGIDDASPAFGTSASEYATLLARASGYSSTLSNVIGTYGVTNRHEGWSRNDHGSAFTPMMNLTLAWLISGEAVYRTKMIGWMQQVIAQAQSRQRTYGHVMLSFGAEEVKQQRDTATDYIRNANEAGNCHWVPVVWDALVDSLDIYNASVADNFGEMVLALFAMAETDDDHNHKYKYTEDRNRVMAGIGAVALYGENARFDGTVMWDVTPDTQTYTPSWAATNLESGLDFGANQMEMYSLLRGTDSNGYIQTSHMMFWPLVAYHNGTSRSPFDLYAGWAEHDEWFLYSTTGAFTHYGTHHAKGSSNHPQLWSDRTPGGQHAYPDAAMAISNFHPDTLSAQVRWLYDEWQDADGPGRIWMRVAFDDESATRTQPTPSNTALTRHFGHVARPGDKMDPNIYEFGKFTSSRSDWNFAIDNETTLCIGYWAGVGSRASHDSGGNGHLSIFHGTHSLQGGAGGNEHDFSLWSREIKSNLRTSAAIIVNRLSVDYDNDGFGAGNYGGGKIPFGPVGVTDEFPDNSWRHTQHRYAVIERVGTSSAGGYFRSDLTLQVPNPTSRRWISGAQGVEPHWPTGTASVDTLFEDIGLNRNYVLRRSVAHTVADSVRMVQISRHMDPDSLVRITDGTLSVGTLASDTRNGQGGGVTSSVVDATFTSARSTTRGAGVLSTQKRRHVTVAWPTSGFWLQTRGGKNNAGHWHQGIVYWDCSSGSKTSQGDASFEFGWCDGDSLTLYGMCDPNAELDEKPPFVGDQRTEVAGYSAMGVIVGGPSSTAGDTISIVTVEQIGAEDMTLVDTRQATGFGDSLVCLVTEDATTPIIWSMPRGIDDTYGMEVTDNINDDVHLEAWGLKPGEYGVTVEGSRTIDSIVVDLDGYASYFIPNQGPTTHIELSLNPSELD